MMVQAILLALAPVFFVMALGYGAGRLGVVDNRHVDGFNALVMDFALPASIFVATASAPRDETLAQAPLFAILGGVMLAVYLGWYAFARIRGGAADASLQALTIAFPNLAGVGLPITSAVLGSSGTVPVAIGLAAGSLIVSPLTLVLVEMNTAKQSAAGSSAGLIARALKRALLKPIVLAPALGIALSLSEIDLGRVADACLQLIGDASAGVALFLTGLILSAQSFRPDWKVIGATIMGDVVRPLLTAAVVFTLPIPIETAKVAVVLAAVPAGFFGILFAVSYRLDSATAGSMVIASTVMSAVTLAVAIALLSPF